MCGGCKCLGLPVPTRKPGQNRGAFRLVLCLCVRRAIKGASCASEAWATRSTRYLSFQVQHEDGRRPRHRDSTPVAASAGQPRGQVSVTDGRTPGARANQALSLWPCPFKLFSTRPNLFGARVVSVLLPPTLMRAPCSLCRAGAEDRLLQVTHFVIFVITLHKRPRKGSRR